MNDLAIRAEGLAKQYKIGQPVERYKTIRAAITDTLWAPVRRFRDRSRRADGNDAPDRIWALKDCTFEVAPGEVVGVVGRNGAGKSTLLKVLSRITEPTCGSAEIRGRIGSLLEVGTGFHPELTGRENVYLNGAILGMRRTRIDAQFDDIVAFAGVEKFVDTPVKHYSSGMYLRLAFAVAAHLETEILLVDEVLAVGDLVFQQRCLAKMGEVARAGRTVLFVSHNMSAVQSLCSRVILMAAGTVVQTGAPAETIEAYTASSRVSASSRQRPIRNGAKATIVQVEVADESQAPTDTVRSGELITVEVTIHAAAAVDRCVVGLTLNTVWGVRICNMRSEDSGFPVSLQPGLNRLAVQFRLSSFLSNVIQVDVGLLHQGAEVLDRATSAATFSVVAGDLSGFGRTRSAGELVYVPSQWSRQAPPECLAQ